MPICSITASWVHNVAVATKMKKPIKKTKGLLVLGLMLLLCCDSISHAQSKSKKPTDRYAEAKSELPEDLYPLYRMLERIMQTNKITEPIGITVRSSSPEDCYAITGNKQLCNVIGDMPDVAPKDSVYAWAIQVVSSTNSDPNASADSTTNLIRMQKSLLNGLSGKPAALACVVAHEVAHLTLKHTKQKVIKGAELDGVASEKISSAINNAKKAQKSQQLWAAIAMGLNAGAGTYQGALSNYQLATAMESDSAEGAQAFRYFMNQYNSVLQARAPKTMGALESLDGLGAKLIKRTKVDIDQYLDEYRKELMAYSRELESEADAKGVYYLANAGINPNECLEVIELIHRSTADTTTSKDSSHPGEDERKASIRKYVDELRPALKNKYKMQQVKLPMLPYVYESNSQIVRVMPPNASGMKQGKNSKSTAVDALLGN